MRGTLSDLKKALLSDDWPAFVLIAGEDTEAASRALAAIEAALPEEDRLTGLERFGTDVPVNRVLDAVRTAPLLGGRRIVVVSGVDWASAGGDEEAQAALTGYLQKPAGTNLLVLVAPKADRRLAVVKAAEARGLVLDCVLPKEREMSGWLAERGRERGLALDPRAAQLLADAVGTDTGLGARELDKLALLAFRDGPKPPAAVDAALVEEALGPTRAAGAFALEDALLAGRADAALDVLARHLAGADAGAPLMLLGRLSSVVRRLSLAAGVVGRGGSEQDVQQALGGHPFVAQKYTQAARRVGARAERALAACVTADGMLKSGRDPRAALTGIVLSLTTAPGRTP